MNTNIEVLLTELCTLVAELGQDGGRVSPSIYDTAQVLRFYPPTEGPEAALDWLIAQQQADGGWGTPTTPLARAVPTLATLLALHQYSSHHHDRSIKAGLAFLQRQACLWLDASIDALPIATEMILPYLLDEANTVGLSIDRAPYHFLYQLRRKKCQQISKHSLVAGTPPVYSWEALAEQARSGLLDESGGIGHSPSATAAWLHQAVKQPALADECHSAIHYLQGASMATELDIPGVVPNVWPITGFELSYGPYALLTMNLFRHPLFQEALNAQMSRLHSIMVHGNGVSFGNYFMADVDDTAVSLATLHANGQVDTTTVLQQFETEEHFRSFPKELNPSVLSNAHALYALARMGEHSPKVEQFLRERQCEDGRWLPDKWHSSWLYTTLEVLLAFDQLDYGTKLLPVADVLLKAQNPDGGWGSSTHSTQAETSYALTALSTIESYISVEGAVQGAINQGYHWLLEQHTQQAPTQERLWLGKELYSPYRVDRLYVVSALLSVALGKRVN